MPDVRAVDHDGLIRVLFGASAFHLFRAGCELNLFDVLHKKGALTEDHLGETLGLQPRAAQILLLGTTSLGLTVRDGERFANAALIDTMIAEGTWEIIKDIVDFEARIVLPAAGDLVESLRQNTNVGLQRISGDGSDLCHRLAAHPELEALLGFNRSERHQYDHGGTRPVECSTWQVEMISPTTTGTL